MRFLLLVAALPVIALAEPATVIRPTALKQEPATDAATVATLPENAAVDALERKGGWRRVKAAAHEGWIRMLELRFGAPDAGKAGDSGIVQLFNVARTGTSGTQVTTGTRGLDAEQIAAAQPNDAELAKMAGYAADRAAAGSFAAKGGLSATHIEYAP